jgi:hypothetical protein
MTYNHLDKADRKALAGVLSKIGKALSTRTPAEVAEVIQHNDAVNREIKTLEARVMMLKASRVQARPLTETPRQAVKRPSGVVTTVRDIKPVRPSYEPYRGITDRPVYSQIISGRRLDALSPEWDFELRDASVAGQR